MSIDNIKKEVERKLILLGSLPTLTGNGATLFDYYLDLGYRKCYIYTEAPYISYTARLLEQSYWAGMEIVDVFSNADGIKVRFNPNERNIKTCFDVINIERKQPDDADIPMITMGLLSAQVQNIHHSLSALFAYSFRKHVIFDRILDYKNTKGMNSLKIVCYSQPSSRGVRNPNEWEQKLTANTASVEERHAARRKSLGITKEEDYFHPNSDWTHDFSEYYRDGIWYVNDIKSKNVNAIGGYRVTTDVPGNFQHTIYTFGPSFCFGSGATDYSTIQSTLQREINLNVSETYRVLNCANAGYPNYDKQWQSLLYHQPKDGDIVIFIETYEALCKSVYDKEILFVDPQRLFDRPHDFGDIFSNTDLHLTSKGYRMCGKYLFEKMEENNIFDENNSTFHSNNEQTNLANNATIKKDEDISIDNYIKSVKENVPKIGSIVMNCNPFTLGHQKLVEYTASQVDWLIIFVVQEDKSFFKFDERFEMVRGGCEIINNVSVIPSGGYIISQKTFGAYFEKDSMQEELIDPSEDVRIFAEKIAPKLGITKRFAGDEPFDMVTKQYNMTMKDLLPKYGIDFEIIERFKAQGEAISATKVRTLIHEKKYDEIKKYVPDSTYKILIQRGYIPCYHSQLN